MPKVTVIIPTYNSETFLRECLDSVINQTLQDIENRTLDSNGDLYVQPVKYLSLQDALTQFSKIEDGFLSLAHPTVFYPIDSLKNSNLMTELYEALHGDFVKFGKGKAKMVENLYQAYFKNTDTKILERIKAISARYKLIPTGGLDTHGKDIFSV